MAETLDVRDMVERLEAALNDARLVLSLTKERERITEQTLEKMDRNNASEVLIRAAERDAGRAFRAVERAEERVDCLKRALDAMVDLASI